MHSHVKLSMDFTLVDLYKSTVFEISMDATHIYCDTPNLYHALINDIDYVKLCRTSYVESNVICLTYILVHYGSNTIICKSCDGVQFFVAQLNLDNVNSLSYVNQFCITSNQIYDLDTIIGQYLIPSKVKSAKKLMN